GTLQNPIDLTPTLQEPHINTAWTNTKSDGTRASDNSCENWTSNELGVNSILGVTHKTDSEWTHVDILLGCDVSSHVYCFEQG
ncbi:MAG: hypothetical protein ACPG77_10790, partial [Nannocystaceae bacterium]